MPTTPTALVVDDDESVREVTVIALEAVAGWQVVSADGGLAALDQAREHDFDVVVLDLMMPDMDGIETFRRLRQLERAARVPVVLLTAKAQVGDAQPWDGVDVAGVISKPFDPMTLASEISALLGWE